MRHQSMLYEDILMSGVFHDKNKIQTVVQDRLNEALKSQYIKLNVGGHLFYTTINTLTKYDNMLRAMFSGRINILADEEGWILLDRSGKHFDKILNFLRDAHVCLPKNEQELNEILVEAKYYLIQELVDLCTKEINALEEELEPICRIPLITSKKEEQILLSTTTKPVVKLLINRHNNKYSYTNMSDDNLLKNIELFDRLSLRFSHRILFIKDILGNNEICCWFFFGDNRKIAEVCCTSIVYTTEKKQTKVDFPEARIYEETLNTLLYESNKNKENATEQMRPLFVDTQKLSLISNVGNSITTNTSDDEDSTNIPSTKDLERVRRLRFHD